MNSLHRLKRSAAQLANEESEMSLKGYSEVDQRGLKVILQFGNSGHIGNVPVEFQTPRSSVKGHQKMPGGGHELCPWCRDCRSGSRPRALRWRYAGSGGNAGCRT